MQGGKEKNKPTKKRVIYVCFDTETAVIQSRPNLHGNELKEIEVVPYLLGWCLVEDLENLDPKNIEVKHSWIYKGDGKTDNPHSEFIDMLIRVSKEYRSVWLVGHNVLYDIKSIMPRCFRFNTRINNHYQELDIWITDKKHIITGIYKSSCIKFRIMDTNRFIFKSLREYIMEIKDLYNLPFTKGEIDYEKYNITFVKDRVFYTNREWKLAEVDKQKEVEYLVTDVIAIPFILKYIDMIKDTAIDIFEIVPPKDKFKGRSYPNLYASKRKSLKGSMMKTAAGFSKNIINWYLWTKYKGTFQQFFRPNSLDAHHAATWSNSSMGGFTFYNKGMLECDFDDGVIVCYDKNSMYPFWMGTLPIKEIYIKPQKTWGDKYVTWHTCIVDDAKSLSWIEKYKNLSTQYISEKRVTRPKGGDNKEFDLPKEVYDWLITVINEKIRIVETFYQESSNCMEGFVEKLYKVKNESDGIKKAASKLMMNALYGKMIQKNFIDETHYNLELDEVVIDIPLEERTLQDTPAGVYIIHMARMDMIKTMMSEIDNGNDVPYGDTDSLVIVQRNPPKFEIDNKKLGAWKSEGEFTSYGNIGKCKSYYIYNKKTDHLKIALSGISSWWKIKIQELGISLEQLQTIFNPQNNVCFIRGKISTRKSEGVYEQYLIENSDLEFNSSLKLVTHEARVVDEKIIITSKN